MKVRPRSYFFSYSTQDSYDDESESSCSICFVVEKLFLETELNRLGFLYEVFAL